MNELEKMSPLEKPSFDNFINREILNFKTGEKYRMFGGREMQFSEEDVSRIADICSQDEIYNILFKHIFKGASYTQESAKVFISRIEQGWKDNNFFVFITRKTNDEIVGAMDIKSANLDNAEVGYWADKNSGGFVTNQLKELVSIARQAGYKKLFADVRVGNEKSRNVLERAGFTKKGEKQVEDRQYEVFEKTLV